MLRRIGMTNTLCGRLNIFKLKGIIEYKSYSLAFKTFMKRLPNALNSYFNVKILPCGIRPANNVSATVNLISGHLI